MSKGLYETTLVIHCCPATHTQTTADLLFQIGLVPTWSPQSLLPHSFCSELSFKASSVQLDELASDLAQSDVLHFELIQNTKHSGVTYLFVPGLGLYRGEFNASGSLTVTEDKLQGLLDQAAGNHREFTRLLRLALGQSWNDILEPFRASKYTDNVVLLNRAG